MPTSSAKAPPDLRARYREGRLIPFVGAGVSMSVTWTENSQLKHGVSWGELVNQAAKLIGFDDPELLRARGSDLQILEFFSVKKHGEFAEITTWFDREMNPPDDAILSSVIHNSLASLARCDLFYTTNYDDFLERSLRLNGRDCTSVAIEAHIATRYKDRARNNVGSPSIEVVKFHGDLKSPSRMVLSESDYENRMNFASVEDQRLKSDLLGRALLFIGYSFRDMNVSYLFRLVNETFGKALPESANGRRAYIVLPDPSDFEYTLFRQRNIDVIGISTTNRTADIAELLDSLESND